ncbi:hypothetical protein [Derxia lacustris]|uniref:hypothetical protein n=1 Tax=Derxia lacustris TaxID=764842 RepID=UPI000A16D228|nr:hypothetical protein [Derxia lacustris]
MQTVRRFSPLPLILAASLGLGGGLVGCDKVKEKASEKLTEKMIESAIEKDGGKAKVDLSNGTVRTTFTDEKGQQSTYEMGGAKISEQDFGLAFYPGAEPGKDGSTRMASAEGEMLMVTLKTADTPAKVAAFYRDKLRAAAKGRQFVDMVEGNGDALLMIADDKDGMQVSVKALEEGGSEITMSTQHRKPGAS